MSPIIVALKALYVALGGALTDTYADIADGIPVSGMVLTSDLVTCLSRLTIGGGGQALYNHNVHVNFEDDNEGPSEIDFNVLTDASAALTYESLYSLLDSRGRCIGAGFTTSGKTLTNISASQNELFVVDNQGSGITVPTTAAITDKVTEI